MKAALVCCVSLLGSSLWACGGAQQAAPATVPAAPALAAATPPPVLPLQVAPSPKDLFLVGRVSQPAFLLDTIGAWANMPLPWESLLENEEPALSKHLRLDAPVELAVALEPDADGLPKILGVVSIALRERAAALESLRQNGKELDHVSADLDYFELQESIQCAVSRANGVAQARLICGPDRKSLDALVPFAASNLPSQALSNKSTFIEFRGEPLRARYGKRANLIKATVPLLLRNVALGNARFDSALADAAYAVADELVLWVDELDSISWSFDLVPQSEELQTDFNLRFRKHRSYTANSLVRRAAEMAPAPEFFWTLPGDAQGAGFAVRRSVEPQDRKVTDTLVELLAGALEHAGLASGPLGKWVEDFRESIAATGPWVVASGAKAAGSSAAGDRLAQAFGYYVLGTERNGVALTALLESTRLALNDKRLRAELTEKLGAELKDLPVIRSRKLAKAPPGLGSVQLFDAVIKLPPKKGEESKKPVTITPVVAVASQGERTWFALALTEDLAVTTLKRVLNPIPGETLAERAGLERMRQLNVLQTSFVTLESIAEAAAGINSKIVPAELKRNMPNHGKTPIFFDATSSVDGPSAQVRVTVPRRAVEDAVALGIALAVQGVTAEREDVSAGANE